MPELNSDFSGKSSGLFKREVWSSYAWDSLLWRMARLPVNALHENRSSRTLHVNKPLERLLSTNEWLTLHSCSALPVSSFPRWFSNNATSTFWYSNLFSLFIESVRHLCGFPARIHHSSDLENCFINSYTYKCMWQEYDQGTTRTVVLIHP